MTKRIYSIYALVDPRNDSVRYVGKTSGGLKERLREHCYYPSKRCNPHKTNWIKSVLDDGFEVVIRLLEECDESKWREREIFWISRFDNLTNKTLGGDGSSGYVPTAETRAKMSKSQTGRHHSEATLAKMRGQRRSEETKRNISLALMGHSISDETRAKISKKISIINTGRRVSQETRKKISDSNKARLSGLTKDQIRNLRPKDPVTGKFIKKVAQ